MTMLRVDGWSMLWLNGSLSVQRREGSSFHHLYIYFTGNRSN